MAVPLVIGVGIGIYFIGLKDMPYVGAVTLLVAAFAILYSRLSHSETIMSGTVRRESGLYADPLSLLTLCTLLLPFVVSKARSCSSPSSVVWWGIVVLGIATGLATGYRVAVFALIVPGYCLLGVRSVRATVLSCAVILSVFALSYGVRSFGLENQLSATRSIHGRAMLLRQGWQALLRNPLTGVGVGALRMTASGVSADDTTLRSQPDPEVYADAKNLFVQFGAELGLPGIVLLLLMMGSFAWLNRRGRALGSVGLACGLGVLILGITESPFGRATCLQGNFLVGMILGLSIVQVPSTTLSSDNKLADRAACT